MLLLSFIMNLASGLCWISEAEVEGGSIIVEKSLIIPDFSPAPAHSTDTTSNNSKGRFFGWIIPTLRTSEFTVLQTVGLDAAVVSDKIVFQW